MARRVTGLAVNAERRLRTYDRKKGLTKLAHSAVEAYGSIKSVTDDFGRTLPYYARIHGILKKYGRQLKGKRLLQLASSTGIYTKFLQDLGVQAVAMDISGIVSSIAKKIGNKRVVVADANPVHADKKTFLPFADKSFHFFVSDRFLFCSYSRVEDFSSSASILEEVARVLKPRGIAIVHFDSIKEFERNSHKTGRKFKILKRIELHGAARSVHYNTFIAVLQKK